MIVAIDNLQLARIARLAGAPRVKGAGVDLFKALGEFVHEGEPLYRIHADYPADLAFAARLAGRATGYGLGSADAVPEPFGEF